MNKENKVTSLELAKKIYDKATEKGFELPDSEYLWCKWMRDGEYEWTLEKNDIACYGGAIEKVPAYDIAELREMIGKKMLETYMNAGKVSVTSYGHPQFDEDTFAEAMGKMYFYLLDNDLL